MKILLVEDDEILVASLTENLTSQHYVVESAIDGQLGWDYAQATSYDLIVLDVNLPNLDGISLCRQLRQANYEGSILLLTAKGDSQHKISGLDAGADDYVVKPCPIDELSARIRALLRRPQGGTSPILKWGELKLDPSTCQVQFASQDISLSPKEYGLLELFLRNPQRVFSSAMLLERLWSFDEIPGEDTIRSHIKRLRRKLKGAGAKEVIENIYGMGYRLIPPPMPPSPQANAAEKPIPSQSQEGDVSPQEAYKSKPLHPQEILSAPTDPDISSDAKVQTAARKTVMAAIGQFRDVIMNRMDILDEAAIAIQSDNLSDELKHKAEQAAHKLAGSLGMFGLIEGSHLGSEIEAHLQSNQAISNGQKICECVTQLHQILDTLLKTAPTGTEAEQGDSHGQTITPEAPSGSSIAPMPSLLVVSTDHQFVTELTAIAQNALHIIPVDLLTQAQQQLSQQLPEAILLDMEAFPDWELRIPFLTELGDTNPHPSLLVLTGQDSFQTRLEITRCCNCTFLPRSTPVPQILDNVFEIHQRHHPSTFRILAVDDDRMVLRTLEQQLSACGMQITTLSDPRQLWDKLLQLKPDLLMLDIQMPHVEGIELCQIIRSDRYWNGLPILFLTACQDAETVQRMYRAGADDHIFKPFSESELVTRILNRLDRNRSTQQLVTVDPTTGLMIEQQALRDIHRNFTLAQRHRQPYCLAMISVDSLELLSAPGQSWLGNRIISNMANTLSQRLRQEDVVAQSGPTTFLLGLYGIHKQKAKQRLELLLQELHEIAYQFIRNKALGPSFRVGIAAAPEEGENILKLRQLVEANLKRVLSSSLP